MDRINKLSVLLLEMCKAHEENNDKKFWETIKRYENEVKLNKLEDELNGAQKNEKH